jgi:hypothetical protein
MSEPSCPILRPDLIGIASVNTSEGHKVRIVKVEFIEEETRLIHVIDVETSAKYRVFPQNFKPSKV